MVTKISTRMTSVEFTATRRCILPWYLFHMEEAHEFLHILTLLNATPLEIQQDCCFLCKVVDEGFSSSKFCQISRPFPKEGLTRPGYFSFLSKTFSLKYFGLNPFIQTLAHKKIACRKKWSKHTQHSNYLFLCCFILLHVAIF